MRVRVGVGVGARALAPNRTPIRQFPTPARPPHTAAHAPIPIFLTGHDTVIYGQVGAVIYEHVLQDTVRFRSRCGRGGAARAGPFYR